MPRSQFSPAYRAFLEVLISARREAGLTQAEVAKRIGRRQGHISVIESGIRRVDVIEFYALARAMGRDPVALFRMVGEQLPPDLDV